MTELCNEPLVSCIMPTCNRRKYVSQALRCFLRQDYPYLELIVVDDGEDPIADCLPDDPRICYRRLEGKHTIGEKRNLACSEARGEIIVHWDDDDWYPPSRVGVQVRALMDHSAQLCGSSQLFFYDVASRQVWLYNCQDRRTVWVAGSTMAYRKSFWARNPFRPLQIGEDAYFAASAGRPALHDLRDPSLCVALRHPGNTAPKITRGVYWTRWSGDLRQVVGADVDFYEAPPAPSSHPGDRLMKLNLGCCDALLPDFVNVDVIPAPGVQVADLRERWPWEESSVEHVRAWDIIEHLPDKVFTMNELWRVLAAGGIAEIAVPTTEGPGAFQDPTHVSFWNRRSFLYYEAGNPYRERFAHHYGIQAKFRVMHERSERTIDGPRLSITLQAIKP